MLYDKPLVSAIVITYCTEHYIKETLDSVFGQDYENYEIIITDDNSNDNTFKIIQDYVRDYKGNHRVIINQNNPNLGIAGNVNKGISLSTGDIICLFDGDDIAYSHRISKSVDVMQELGVHGLTLNMEYIDSKSCPKGFFVPQVVDKSILFTIDDYLQGKLITAGAARAFTRQLVDIFGPLGDCQTEDSTYMFRTMLTGRTGFNYEPMMKYRIHGNNISGFHNLMTKFDPPKIYNQYKKDLELAYTKHIITDKDYYRVLNHINQYLYHNIAVRKLYKTPMYILRLLRARLYMFDSRYGRIKAGEYVRIVKQWHNNGTR